MKRGGHQELAGRRLWSVPVFLRHHAIDPGELPLSILLLIEMQLRIAEIAGQTDGGSTGGFERAAELLQAVYDGRSPTAVQFLPSRVVMQDASGIPVLADLTDYGERLASELGPRHRLVLKVPAALIVDHSGEPWQTDTADCAERNLDEEYRRNAQRYAFLKTASRTFPDLTVFPPGNGIIHQVNFESLSLPVVERDAMLFPDSCFGTDSHTPMINALGTLGWGGGGVEALGALLGEPMIISLPEILAVRLTGQRQPGVTATDIALAICHTLRHEGMVGAIAEFVGDGVRDLSLQERATIANMSPEYGVLMSLFPIDEAVERFWRGRSADAAELALRYHRYQGFQATRALPGRYARIVDFDLRSVGRTISGPSLPHQAIALADFSGYPASPTADLPGSLPTGRNESPKRIDGDVVLAAITSCTNTANDEVLARAALFARRALARGLAPAPHVKTVFAPGSHACVERLERAGLLADLTAFGFGPSLYGCGPCVGNVGGLRPDVEADLAESPVDVVAVISGNRNFQGRIHARVRSNFLASPPTVLAFAVRGNVRWRPEAEPVAGDAQGRPVRLVELMPSDQEVADAVERMNAPDPARSRVIGQSGSPVQHRASFHDYAARKWQAFDAGGADAGCWPSGSTYFHRPPFLASQFAGSALTDIIDAAPLLVLGDHVTTDHISPVGAIPADSVAGEYLCSLGVAPAELGSYAGRRVNHHVMVRGTFANPRLKNLMLDAADGPFTLDVADDHPGSVYEIAMRYLDRGVPSVVFAGEAYGSGSARDWAAKGTRLLGVRAVIARSFERIHRSNLLALGVLPLVFDGSAVVVDVIRAARRVSVSGLSAAVPGGERPVISYDITGLRNRPLLCTIEGDQGTTSFPAYLDVRTTREVSWLAAGGLLFDLLGNQLRAAAT